MPETLQGASWLHVATLKPRTALPPLCACPAQTRAVSAQGLCEWSLEGMAPRIPVLSRLALAWMPPRPGARTLAHSHTPPTHSGGGFVLLWRDVSENSCGHPDPRCERWCTLGRLQERCWTLGRGRGTPGHLPPLSPASPHWGTERPAWDGESWAGAGITNFPWARPSCQALLGPR